jgi:tRNA threonylcarbamoyladenosine biosynthesis protein TsaB
MLLSIDTSSKNSGVALIRKDYSIINSIEWTTEYNHTPDLLPTIDRILTESKVNIANLKGIAINIGPGQFSGLRVGVTTAKTISWSYNVPMVVSNSLEILAYSHKSSTPTIICPIINLNKIQMAWSLFRSNDGKLTKIQEPTIIPKDDLLEKITSTITKLGYMCKKSVIICEEAIENLLYFERLNTIEITNTTSSERIINLAKIGMEKLNNNEITDPTSLEPFYLRPPTINKTK